MNGLTAWARTRRIILSALTVIIAAHSPQAADGAGIVDRRGRSVQVDGFLLEWKRADAKPWPGGADWEWDAVVTPAGVAGYFRPRSAPACTAWAFDISPPEEAADTDRENHATEWLIPDINTERITVTASSACGDTLPVLALTVSPPQKESSPTLYYMVLIMAVAAALTAWLAVKRRKAHNKATA